jgi:hypothetical protein
MMGFLSDQVLSSRKREDIRAIVIAGEASASAIAELTAITRDVVGTDVVKVMNDIDPSEVAAHGAAAIARWTQRIDGRTLATTGNMLPDEKYWAEEEAHKQAKAREHEEL